jgi:hypothetical protein
MLPTVALEKKRWCPSYEERAGGERERDRYERERESERGRHVWRGGLYHPWNRCSCHRRLRIEASWFLPPCYQLFPGCTPSSESTVYISKVRSSATGSAMGLVLFVFVGRCSVTDELLINTERFRRVSYCDIATRRITRTKLTPRLGRFPVIPPQLSQWLEIHK